MWGLLRLTPITLYVVLVLHVIGLCKDLRRVAFTPALYVHAYDLYVYYK